MFLISVSLPHFNYAQVWLGLEHFIEITVASSHSKHLILHVPSRNGEESVGEICVIDCQVTLHTLHQPAIWQSTLGVGGGERGFMTSLFRGTHP